MKSQPAQLPVGGRDRHSRILVVDDERNIRLLIRAVLDSEGYDIAEAADGAAALEALRDGHFDLVLLDLNMPVVDGMTVLQRLEEDTTSGKPSPRTVVLTAHGSISAAVRATRLGALDFLEKPVTPAELRSVVKAVLAEPQAARNDVTPAASGFDGVLGRVRTALRASDVATAETLLMQAANLGENVAEYYNLLGILYEIRGQRRLARKFYSKAMGADPRYAPAGHNMRRMYELDTFGKTDVRVALGDGQDTATPGGARKGTPEV